MRCPMPRPCTVQTKRAARKQQVRVPVSRRYLIRAALRPVTLAGGEPVMRQVLEMDGDGASPPLRGCNSRAGTKIKPDADRR